LIHIHNDFNKFVEIDASLFHRRPLNGNGKIVILCGLRASSEAGGE